ncbi:MAG: hypothetical protein JW990_03695 [Thermoleophilia bacterium]|nr:hypothetical protein [Thermoleophilia bacterium]
MGPVLAVTDVVAGSKRLGLDGTLAELVLTLGAGSPCVCCGSLLVRCGAGTDTVIAVCPGCGAELALAAEAALPQAA